MNTTATDYESQARAVAERIGLQVKIERTAQACPKWGRDARGYGCTRCGGVHGDRFRVTLRNARCDVLTFRGRAAQRQAAAGSGAASASAGRQHRRGSGVASARTKTVTYRCQNLSYI